MSYRLGPSSFIGLADIHLGDGSHRQTHISHTGKEIMVNHPEGHANVLLESTVYEEGKPVLVRRRSFDGSDGVEPPGKLGWSLMGDNSLWFSRDPLGFLSSNMEQFGFVFKARLFNSPHVFVTSHDTASELLAGPRHEHFSVAGGYTAFMSKVYGENMLMLQHGEARRASRAAVCACFRGFAEATAGVIADLAHSAFSDLGPDVNIYEVAKEFCTQVSCKLFLGVDAKADPNQYARVCELLTTHWHGLISVPVKIPGFTNGKKLSDSARVELLDLIAQLIETARQMPSEEAANSPCLLHRLAHAMPDGDAAQEHALLFASALVPKALASLVTSFVLEVARPANAAVVSEFRDLMVKSSDEASGYLSWILKEVQRLHPAFIGGRREATCDTKLADYRVPKGWKVMYVPYFINRDARVYPHPHELRPRRWQHCHHPVDANVIPEPCPSLMTFGGGETRCVGDRLAQTLFSVAAQGLLDRYNWELATPPVDAAGAGSGGLHQKLLPVCRPYEATVHFHPR